MKKILSWFYRRKYRNAEMVHYWKTSDSVAAKVTQSKEGHYQMHMKGEKYPFPGYPRGILLYGPLSPLKHQIKNKIFNDTWAAIEDGVDEEWIEHLKKEVLQNTIMPLFDQGRYDMLPFEKMVPPVKELYRAFTVVAEKTNRKNVIHIRDLICFILQEDDAYRFRFQWLAKFFNPNSWWRKMTGRDPLKDFDFALSMLEHGESIGDMKERQRLLRRVLMFVLKDEGVRTCFDLFIKELDWKKVQLSKADKYYFRAKYFKVDYPEYSY